MAYIQILSLADVATFSKLALCEETLVIDCFRSSHRRCSVRKSVLRNFAKFTGKRLCQSLLFNKVTGLRAATLLKKRLWHRCFPVNIAKSLRTPFSQNTSGRLLLLFSSYLKRFCIFRFLCLIAVVIFKIDF